MWRKETKCWDGGRTNLGKRVSICTEWRTSEYAGEIINMVGEE